MSASPRPDLPAKWRVTTDPAVLSRYRRALAVAKVRRNDDGWYSIVETTTGAVIPGPPVFVSHQLLPGAEVLQDIPVQPWRYRSRKEAVSELERLREMVGEHREQVEMEGMG